MTVGDVHGWVEVKVRAVGLPPFWIYRRERERDGTSRTSTEWKSLISCTHTHFICVCVCVLVFIICFSLVVRLVVILCLVYTFSLFHVISSSLGFGTQRNKPNQQPKKTQKKKREKKRISNRYICAARPFLPRRMYVHCSIPFQLYIRDVQ